MPFSENSGALAHYAVKSRVLGKKVASLEALPIAWFHFRPLQQNVDCIEQKVTIVFTPQNATASEAGGCPPDSWT